MGVRRAGVADATIRSAATVMLVRDRAELEVFVLQRTAGAVFGPGATVFPGGAVDETDADALDRVIGLDDATASAELGLASGGLIRRVAAVRECLEEAGILLARHARTLAPATPVPEWRDALNGGHATIAHVLTVEDLVIDARDMHVFAHWLTPRGAPRRYDTWFFVAHAPDDQDGAHDDSELVASAWVTPVAALAAHARGEIDLVSPTQRSLTALARFDSVAELFGALDRAPRDAEGRPRVVADAAGERIVLPGDNLRASSHWTIPLPDISMGDEQRIITSGSLR